MDEHITDNFLFENLIIQLNNKQLRVYVYDTPLGKRWVEALKDNLKQKIPNLDKFWTAQSQPSIIGNLGLNLI